MLVSTFPFFTNAGRLDQFNQMEKYVICFNFFELECPAMPIKVAQLRTFAIVSQCGNIKDAAERLGRTPSAVSMALKQLEEELGGRLFEADRKNALTPLGRYVLDTAQEELVRFERAVAKMRAFAGNQIGRLELACVPSVAMRILPDVIGDFVSARPEVQLEVWDMDSLSVRRAVEGGEVELGIASLSGADGALDYQQFFADDFGVVCAADCPLTRFERPVQWNDLGDLTLISNGLSRSVPDPAYRALEQHSRLMVRNVTSILALVRRGFGVTLLPRLSVPRDDNQIRFLPLAVSGIRRNVGVISRAGTTLSPVARAFCKVLIQYAPRELDALVKLN